LGRLYFDGVGGGGGLDGVGGGDGFDGVGGGDGFDGVGGGDCVCGALPPWRGCFDRVVEEGGFSKA